TAAAPVAEVSDVQEGEADAVVPDGTPISIDTPAEDNPDGESPDDAEAVAADGGEDEAEPVTTSPTSDEAAARKRRRRGRRGGRRSRGVRDDATENGSERGDHRSDTEPNQDNS